MENNEDFSQDVKTDQNFSRHDINGENGGCDSHIVDSGSADLPGRDDDRLALLCLNYLHIYLHYIHF